VFNVEWNGQDTLPTTLYIWTEAELVRRNMRRKYREYTDGLDVLTQHQVTLSLLSYMCLIRSTLYHNLTQLRNFRCIGVLGMLRSSSTISVLSLGTSQTNIAATSLLFSSMWSRFTCPSGSADSLKEWQAAHHRFTPPTKNCMGVLSINNKATIQRCV